MGNGCHTTMYIYHHVSLSRCSLLSYLKTSAYLYQRFLPALWMLHHYSLCLLLGRGTPCPGVSRSSHGNQRNGWGTRPLGATCPGCSVERFLGGRSHQATTCGGKDRTIVYTMDLWSHSQAWFCFNTQTFCEVDI